MHSDSKMFKKCWQKCYIIGTISPVIVILFSKYYCIYMWFFINYNKKLALNVKYMGKYCV